MSDISALCLRSSLLVSVILVAGFVQPARAVVVATTTENTTAPEDNFGFENVAVKGSATAIYLGYGWVLTAGHCGVGSVELNGVVYENMVATGHILTNPTDEFDRYGNPLTEQTDLILFRLEESPHLPALTISESSPAALEEVVMVGQGYDREAEMTGWDIGGSYPSYSGDWVWVETTDLDNCDNRGFDLETTRDIRWGTNLVESDMQSDEDNNLIVTVNSKDVLALKIEFNEDGGTTYEAQAANGDSGGGVFHKRDGEWELAGIINAVSLLPDQPGGHIVFGQKTYAADLSEYRDQILEIITPLMADADLDGIVNANDVSLIAAHWQTPSGAIWEDGDFNDDGVVNALDVSLLATHWQEGVPERLSGVPEPTTLLLLIAGVMTLLLRRSLAAR